jgi:hypothetical protein
VIVAAPTAPTTPALVPVKVAVCDPDVFVPTAPVDVKVPVSVEVPEPVTPDALSGNETENPTVTGVPVPFVKVFVGVTEPATASVCVAVPRSAGELANCVMSADEPPDQVDVAMLPRPPATE